MKITNLVVIFLMILLPIIAIGDLKYEANAHAISLSRRYDVILEKSVHDGAKAMMMDYIKSQEGVDQSYCINPQQGIDQFLETMGVNLGIDSNTQRQELLFYLPCIIVIDYDGIYLYGVQAYQDDLGHTHYEHILQPKIFFSYRVGDYILSFHMNGEVVVYDINTQMQLLYTLEEAQALEEFKNYPLGDIKNRIVAEQVGNALNKQVNLHNFMAHQNGIAYTFYVPLIDEAELVNAFKDVGMIAFFQGVPLSSTERLNLFAFGGAQIFKRAAYYGYTRNSIRYVCKEGCIENSSIAPENIFHTLKEAAEEGFFPCPTCKP